MTRPTPSLQTLAPAAPFRTCRALAASGVLLLAALPAAAQGPGAGSGLRLGVSAGGISSIGFTVEYLHDTRGYDLTVGTWSFHDLSASFTIKEYFGAGALKPFVGAGLWLVAAAPPEERTGLALVLQAPVGVDWTAVSHQHLGLTLNVNRGLWVRRTDPEDDLPMNHRLVPLPGAYYRWSN